MNFVNPKADTETNLRVVTTNGWSQPTLSVRHLTANLSNSD